MDLTKTSRYLSLILRHKPEVIGITLDEHGWAQVEPLVAGIAKTRPFSRAMLEEIVRTDEKQRYAFSADKTRIRANQGHSIPVDVELAEEQPPEYLWHGTGQKYQASISGQGLLPKSRLYVHLSPDVNTALKVGRRHGEPVLYQVASGRMARAGHPFYRSANGVWLAKAVPPEYLRKMRPGPAEVIQAHSFSAGNRAALRQDARCGCFSCGKVFDPAQIRDWLCDSRGETAICPYCGGDSILGESAGCPLTPEFLQRMREYWF